MSRAFKRNLKLEKAWDDWADEVLSQGNIEWFTVAEESGSYYWCFSLDSGIQRFCTNAPEHIQAKLGVPEDSQIANSQLGGRCYWFKKHQAMVGDAE